MMTRAVIKRTIEEFAVALEMMNESSARVHAFDVGHDAEGRESSLVIILMPKDEADRMLEQFKQLESAMQNVRQAVGLGTSTPITFKDSTELSGH